MTSHKTQSVLILKSEQLSLHNPKTSDKYAEMCRNVNIPTDVVHVIDFEFHNLPALLEKLKNPEQYSGLIFTSPRPVKAVAMACQSSLNDKWLEMPVFAIGERTSAIAKGVLGVDCLGSSSGCGFQLAQVITKYKDKLKGKPLLLPHGNITSDSLLDNLKDTGITCDQIEVYTTKPHPSFESSLVNVLSKRKISAVIFFSPSGVQFGLPVLKKHISYIHTVKFMAIGPTTEGALIEAGLTVSGTALKPSPSSVAQILEKIMR